MTEEQGSSRKRVGVVATDSLRVLGLASILEGKLDLEIVELSVPGALDGANLSVILIDSDCTGHLFELLATFRRRRPQLKLIVLGKQHDHEYIQQVIGAGAKGYLLHTAREDEIRLAIEIVQDGSVWAPRKVMARLIESARVQGPPPTAKERQLTPREHQVLVLLKAGRPNRDIAVMLEIDEATVKAHVGRLLRKVGVDNRIALTMQAIHRETESSPDVKSS